MTSNMMPFKKEMDSIPLEHRVLIEQMRILCRQKLILAVLAVTVLCLVVFMWGIAPQQALWFVIALSVVTAFFRLRVVQAFIRLDPEDVDTRIWHGRFVRMALGSSFSFVSLEILGYMTMPNGSWGLFDIAVISACGAALGTMAVVPNLYSIFVLSPLVVMIGFHMAAGGIYNLFIALGTFVIAVAYLVTSRHVGTTLTQSLQLRMQNEILMNEAEQQQQYLATVLNSLPDATFVIDIDGVVTAWNQAAERLTGVTAQEIIGKGTYEYALAFYGERRPALVDMIFEPDLSSWQDRYGQFLQDGDTISGEGFLVARGLWFDACASPLRDLHGTIIGAIETVRDVTVRKQVQLELASAKQRLDDIINLLPDAAFVVNEKGVITAWNLAAERMTGARAADMIGKGNREYSIPFYGERRPIMVDMLLEPDSAAFERYQHLHLDSYVISGEAYIRPMGNERWIQAYATLLHDAQGMTTGAIETVRDITDHKQLEEDLQQSGRKLTQIIDLLPEATFVIDCNGVVVAWSRAAEQLSGVSAADIVGKGDYEYGVAFYGERRPILIDLVFLPEHELLSETYSHVRRVGPALVAESLVSMRNGRNAWLQGSAAVLRDADGAITGAIEVVIDLTERKQFEDELAAAREVAERATRAKGDFLANMSHEIRTPMNAIIGMTHLALQTELTPIQRNYIRKANRAAENLLGIINEILDFSKIEAGKLSLEEVTFNLSDVFHNLAGLLGFKAEEKGLELLFDIAPALPTALVGDPLRFGQILINLCNNAIKFTEQGDVIIGVEAVSQTSQEIILHCWVKDSGIGMTHEQQQQLFQSFSQADSSTTRKYGGTGLGLAISKNLVELMGGAIWVESEYGVGSTFHIHVYFGVQSESMQQRLLSREELVGRRLLVVDDSSNAREILAAMVRGCGMEVAVARDGRQALEMLAARTVADPFDLVLLDWKMPGLDGVDCLQEMENAGLAKDTKVVMVTGFGRDDVLHALEDRGLPECAVLTKPVIVSSLLAVIGDTLGTCSLASGGPLEKGVLKSESIQQLRGARLLLVEDNEMNQELALALLGGAEIDVVLATNGLEALAVLSRDCRFDGVLMDCQMPIMDGYTATREIRKNPAWSTVPIIAMTANLISGERERVRAVGMCDLIGKPLDINAMFETLSRWIVPATPLSVCDHAKPAAERPVTMPHQLPGIDWQAGMAATMHNAALYQRMLIRFCETQGNFAAVFRSAQQDPDPAAATRSAHTLKGTAGTIGAREVRHAAEQLESACRLNAHEDEIDRLLALTLDALQPVLEGLRFLDADRTTPVTVQLDARALRPLLDNLLRLLEDNDLEAGDVAEELLQATRETPLAEQVAKVVAAVTVFDVQKALLSLYEVSSKLDEIMAS